MRTLRTLDGPNFNKDRLAFAFAALGEPGGEPFGEAFGREAKTRFNAAIGDRKCVVKIGGVGEIAHAKLIEPIQRAGSLFAADDNVDRELLGIHASILAGRAKGEVVADVR